MAIRSFAKANFVEFLDLCAPEFHETRSTTLIYALDLSVAPQRYYYITEWFDETRDETIVHLRSRFENGHIPPFAHLSNKPLYSSKKLIEVPRLHGRDFVALSFPFIDFVTNVFKSFSSNWESEIMRIYLKYVKTYCHYLEESIMVRHQSSGNVILTFERPPIVYNANINSRFISEIKRKVAENLILTLFENNSADSSLVAEIFHTMFTDQQRIDILFALEAKLTEWILNLLKTEMYDIRYIFETLEESSRNCTLLRSNPEHLLVFLNYGFKIKSQLHKLSNVFFLLHPSHSHQFRRNPDILRGLLSDANAREKAILDIIAHFLNFSGQRFAVYLNSLRYIWRSIPDTYITYEEMTTLLLRIADITFVAKTCSEILEWEFDSFDYILQPRSLTHYSRCVLRDALTRNSQLPEGIELLALPSQLKSYLRLEF